MYSIGAMKFSKIARHGNSLFVRVPAAWARELGFRDGESVLLRRTNRGVVVEHASVRRLTVWLQTVRDTEPEVYGRTAAGREVPE
jgi:antitoxin component of MazEF toxin-antitoxin module